MSDGACNETIEWVEWHRTSEVDYRGLWKNPTDAPDPELSMSEQIDNMTAAADRDTASESETPLDCPLGCSESTPVVVRRKEFNRPVRYAWDEKYPGRDDEGNVVTLTARYTANGRADFEKVIKQKDCAPPSFGNVSYNLDDIEVTVPAALLLTSHPDELYAILEREGLLEEVRELHG